NRLEIIHAPEVVAPGPLGQVAEGVVGAVERHQHPKRSGPRLRRRRGLRVEARHLEEEAGRFPWCLGEVDHRRRLAVLRVPAPRALVAPAPHAGYVVLAVDHPSLAMIDSVSSPPAPLSVSIHLSRSIMS